ncbi:MAG: class I SAM-dependent methyltransferase [Oscillospiraceae bacterium]|nr:class I SAM-dependent methyltransferase [Oscillospiraceae bacterium]
MSGYSAFAYFYDRLTENISYKARAEYFDSLIKLHGGKKGILLDLACGTGSLSEELAKMGYDVIGTDASEEMLSCAMDKKFESGLPIQYLCQDMTRLDMFGTIDVTLCALDSINHLGSLEDIRKTFERVSLFCEPGGLFIFDMNTPYKHKNILGNSTYVYDLEDVYCVWQNTFAENSPDNRVDISLDIFEKNENGAYDRYTDELSEIAFEREIIEKVLTSAGMTVEAVYDYDSLEPPRPESEKLVFVAKKPMCR